LCIYDVLGGETGSHIWTSLLYGSEIVRVQVRPSATDASARALLDEMREQRRAFELALESGQDSLPENPAGLLPAVRKLRFDPPARSNEAVPLEVEDYRLGVIEATRARRLTELLPRLWMLRLSRDGDA
jgi:ATP-dependent Clp protease ATP-binding subunit ClpA/ATP-dependent Clp protease ATP-binding subunit ClpC